MKTRGYLVSEVQIRTLHVPDTYELEYSANQANTPVEGHSVSFFHNTVWIRACSSVKTFLSFAVDLRHETGGGSSNGFPDTERDMILAARKHHAEAVSTSPPKSRSGRTEPHHCVTFLMLLGVELHYRSEYMRNYPMCGVMHY